MALERSGPPFPDTPLFQRGPVADLLRADRYDEALNHLHAARDRAPGDGELATAIRVVRDHALRRGLERIGSLDAVARCARTAATGLGSDEQYLYDRIARAAAGSSREALDALLDGSTLGRHRTVRALLALIDQGFVELHRDRPARAGASASLGAAITPRRVIVADGNAAQAALTRTMLRLALGAGAQLGTATSAAGLVAAAESAPPDLVAVEFTLPGADGIAALRALRRAIGAETPALVIAQRVELSFVSARAPERASVLARPIEKATLHDALGALGIAGARGRI